MSAGVVITPAGISAGKPAVVATLCKQAGAGVLAYCRVVASPGQATLAATEALARFRSEICARSDMSGAEAMDLLRSSTIRAAAERGVNVVAARGRGASDGCSGPETELLRYVEGGLTPSQNERVVAHLADCQMCAAALHRLEAGARAYARPPEGALAPSDAVALAEAMIMAAPVKVDDRTQASVRLEVLRLLGPADEPEARTAASPPVTGAYPQGLQYGELQPARSAFRRTSSLLRGGGRLLAVVGLAVVGGLLVGTALSKLGGDGESSLAPIAPQSSSSGTSSTGGSQTGATTTNDQAGTSDELVIDVLSAIVHPVTETAAEANRQARLGVHLRIRNVTERTLKPTRPVLLVGRERVRLAGESAADAMPLLSELDPDAVADGTLRFETKGALTSRLTGKRVRLRVFDTTVPVTAKLGTPIKAPA